MNRNKKIIIAIVASLLLVLVILVGVLLTKKKDPNDNNPNNKEEVKERLNEDIVENNITFKDIKFYIEDGQTFITLVLANETGEVIPLAYYTISVMDKDENLMFMFADRVDLELKENDTVNRTISAEGNFLNYNSIKINVVKE